MYVSALVCRTVNFGVNRQICPYLTVEFDEPRFYGLTKYDVEKKFVMFLSNSRTTALQEMPLLDIIYYWYSLFAFIIRGYA